jgi:7-cyano-7-deazaguanine synthase
MGGANVPARVAVLVSGGVDSAVLVAELCDQCTDVYPLYVRSGLIWEETELKYLRSYLQAVARSELRPLEILELPVRDVYGDHWATTGRLVPDANTEDEAVFLPGRNLFLIGKAAVWCALHDVSALALGSLKANPFGDSSPEFDDLFGQLILRALGKPLQIVRPFSDLAKQEVLQRGLRLPLDRTFSCINPIHDTHCGMCNKCAERRRGFESAGLEDRTSYYPSNPVNSTKKN